MPRRKCNGTTLYYELHGAGGRPVTVLNNGTLMMTEGGYDTVTEVGDE